jgi:hypothetical protein
MDFFEITIRDLKRRVKIKVAKGSLIATRELVAARFALLTATDKLQRPDQVVALGKGLARCYCCFLLLYSA